MYNVNNYKLYINIILILIVIHQLTLHIIRIIINNICLTAVILQILDVSRTGFRVVGALGSIIDKSLIIIIQDFFKNILENNLIQVNS